MNLLLSDEDDDSVVNNHFNWVERNVSPPPPLNGERWVYLFSNSIYDEFPSCIATDFLKKLLVKCDII